MELRHLRYFVAVAEELNFTRAAARMYTVQPSLSQQIKDLEQEVGVQLLLRSNRKVELTPEGEAFLKQARLCLDYADKAIQEARQVAQAQKSTVEYRLCAGGRNESVSLYHAEYSCPVSRFKNPFS